MNASATRTFETFANNIARDASLSPAAKARYTWMAWTRYCSRSRLAAFKTGARTPNFLTLLAD